LSSADFSAAKAGVATMLNVPTADKASNDIRPKMIEFFIKTIRVCNYKGFHYLFLGILYFFIYINKEFLLIFYIGLFTNSFINIL
jgi:hypothetical protein